MEDLKYMILVDGSFTGLTRKVNKSIIEEGWKPTGGLAILKGKEDIDVDYFQAMIKE
jgi:hypothetical protein